MLILTLALLITNIKIKLKKGALTIHILLVFIPIFFLADVIFFYTPYSPLYFFPLNKLIGIEHKLNVFMFCLLLSLVLLKLIGIKIYFNRNTKVIDTGGGDKIFQFFTNGLNYRKLIMGGLLFPLSAFTEELLFRSLLLSFFMLVFNSNLIIGVIFISCVFGFVHYSEFGGWGHVISALISSLIYFVALIQIGLFYAWFFHLITNLLVLVFYYQARMKK